MTADEMKAARARMSMTQARMAEAIGVTPRAVQYWEAGRRKVPASVAKLIGRILRERETS